MSGVAFRFSLKIQAPIELSALNVVHFWGGTRPTGAQLFVHAWNLFCNPFSADVSTADLTVFTNITIKVELGLFKQSSPESPSHRSPGSPTTRNSRETMPRRSSTKEAAIAIYQARWPNTDTNQVYAALPEPLIWQASAAIVGTSGSTRRGIPSAQSMGSLAHIHSDSTLAIHTLPECRASPRQIVALVILNRPPLHLRPRRTINSRRFPITRARFKPKDDSHFDPG
ncbi:hypothetical protein BJV74DRAFT_889575 [Russula compacta]|nr:hypothetical protein BJV74DRAFT_889575 [Russula compacta]